MHLKRAALAAVLLQAFSLHAQTADEAAVVVVATRQPSRVNSLAADVTVLEREQIEQAGLTATLGDLLARTPGIELSRAGIRGAAESVFIRGANAGHTLVLVDGLRIGSATLGQTSIASIPLAQVERIEILRGAASALYGSEAIGGVIRISTKPGADAPRLTASLGVGSRGTQEATLAHAGAFGDLRYALRFGDSSGRGVNVITNPTSAAFNPDRDGFWRRNVALHAAWQPQEGAEIGGHWLESDGANKFDTSFPTANADWQTRNKLVSQAAYARLRPADGWNSELRVGRGEDLSVTTPSQTPGQARDSFHTRQDQVVWQNDVSLPLGRALVALETLREEVASTNVYTNTRRTTDSVVLGWNGSTGAHFWQAGARRDDNSQFGGKSTGNVGYGYRLAERWRVSASTGTSFKAPTFNDLYFPNTPFVGVGNPNLQPESGRSKEAALHYEAGATAASLTVFRNDIRNLIQWQETTPGSWFYAPVNVGEARISGATAAWRTRLGEWRFDAHATAQSPKDRASGEDLVRRARKFGVVAVGRDTGRWSSGVELHASGVRYDAPDFVTGRNTRKMGGYGLVHLRGEYRLDGGWALFARVDNLFDKRYELVQSSTTNFAALGTQLFVGARFTLN